MTAIITVRYHCVDQGLTFYVGEVLRGNKANIMFHVGLPLVVQAGQVRTDRSSPKGSDTQDVSPARVPNVSYESYPLDNPLCLLFSVRLIHLRVPYKRLILKHHSISKT